MWGQEPVGTAVPLRQCKYLHRVQYAGGLLWYREVIFISLELLHSLLPHSLLASSHHVRQQLGVAGGGGDEGDSSYVSKISLCALCWKSKRTELSFVPFKVLFLTVF